MLIDISDVLQICCYELGRTYLKLSQALCLNIPSLGEFFIFYFTRLRDFMFKTGICTFLPCAAKVIVVYMKLPMWNVYKCNFI